MDEKMSDPKCLLKAETLYYTSLGDINKELKHAKDHLLRQSLEQKRRKLREERQMKFLQLIQRHISDPEGIILPIITIGQSEGIDVGRIDYKIILLSGDRIRITSKLIRVWQNGPQHVDIPLLDAVNGIKLSGEHTFSTNVDYDEQKEEDPSPSNNGATRRKKVHYYEGATINYNATRGGARKRTRLSKGEIERYRTQEASVIGNTIIRVSRGRKNNITKALNTVITQKVKQFTKFITIALIKDLLKDLIPGDEVELDQAVQVVLEERKIRYPEIQFSESNQYIEEFFKLIGINISGFQYVHLKKGIRCVSDISAQIDKIDALFQDWDSTSAKKKKD